MLNFIEEKVYGLFSQVKTSVKEEKGAELMEWIGMCLVVLAIMGAVISFFDGTTGIGSQIQSFITDQIDNLSGE
ncbi:hypothetical protein [Virgibacillus doumboii]|uniref:hypothetical protein n=1 Tax=Virgibacillus doumboii TaxID=2697503 RepID=UPI0013E01902|nr:hypothetical protein [Virgibacillus doumboii]